MIHKRTKCEKQLMNLCPPKEAMDERGRRQANEQYPESTSSVSELADGNGRMAPSTHGTHTHHKILSKAGTTSSAGTCRITGKLIHLQENQQKTC